MFFEIELVASDGLELPVSAMFDTGFTYWLAIDNQDLDALNWAFLRQQTMQTARGDFDFDIYAGKIKLGSQEYDIPVHVGEGLSEVGCASTMCVTHRILKNGALRLA